MFNVPIIILKNHKSYSENPKFTKVIAQSAHASKSSESKSTDTHRNLTEEIRIQCWNRNDELSAQKNEEVNSGYFYLFILCTLKSDIVVG